MSSLINVGRKLIFCHVPKNAGSSVALSLINRGGFRPIDYETVDNDLTMGWQKGECARIAAHLGADLWNACRKFALIRNPWDRLVSSWAFTRRRNKHGLSFEQFVRDLPSLDPAQEKDALGRAISVHWHTMPQLGHLTIQGRQVVDFLGRVESLERDWAQLCQLIDCPVPLPPRRNVSDHQPYRC
jgi:hypothetical protein